MFFDMAGDQLRVREILKFIPRNDRRAVWAGPTALAICAKAAVSGDIFVDFQVYSPGQ
jgi:hypothetical protein